MRTGPLVWGPGGMLFALSRESVDEVLRSNRFGHHPDGSPPRNTDVDETLDREAFIVAVNSSMFLNMDPPDHTRMRRIVTRAFTPRAVERLTAAMRQVTERALDAAAASGHIELIGELARPGRAATLTGVAIGRFRGGHLTELWLQADLLAFLQQLDVLPPLRLAQAVTLAQVLQAGAQMAPEPATSSPVSPAAGSTGTTTSVI